jgi:hypothetical protein
MRAAPWQQRLRPGGADGGALHQVLGGVALQLALAGRALAGVAQELLGGGGKEGRGTGAGTGVGGGGLREAMHALIHE